MLMRIILGLLCWLALVSCASYAEMTKDDDAEDFPDNCTENTANRPPQVRNVKIVYTPNDIDVRPSPICVRPGDVLKFHLVGAANTLVKIEGKTPASKWLSGGKKTTSEAPGGPGERNQDWFFVVVPFDLLPDSVPDAVNYSYYSVSAGSVDKDPEVRVKNHYN